MSQSIYICIRYCEVFGYLHLLAWGKWDGSRATNGRIVWRVSVQVRSIPLFPSCIQTFLLILNMASTVPFFIWMLLLWSTRRAARSGRFACWFAHSVTEGWTRAGTVQSVCILHPDLQRPASLLSTFGHYHLGSTLRGRLPYGRHFCQC